MKAELLGRNTAKRLGSAEVINLVLYATNPKRIGKGSIAVPSAFVKIIYNDAAKFQRCFYFENETATIRSKRKLSDYELSCDEIL